MTSKAPSMGSYQFQSKDCPEGLPGAVRFPLMIPLKDGAKLTLLLGSFGLSTVWAVLTAMLEGEPEAYAEAKAFLKEIKNG